MSVQRTIYATYLQNCLYQDLLFVLSDNSTLNAKLNIHKDVDIPPGVTPRLKYWAIGNGGHNMTVAGNGLAISIPKVHRATDAALYNQIPFVLRESNDDLSTAEQALYGLRRQETHGGVDYWAYYLKRLDFSDTVPTMKYSINDAGVITTNEFVPTNDNLNPEPPTLLADGSNPTEAEYVHVEALTTVQFTQKDRDELMEVARILYGDEKYALISEIALCSGVDRQLSVPAQGGGTQSFNEAIAVQCNHFVQLFRQLEYDNRGFDITLNLGGTDPMVVEQA